jgi:hypothetical protein
MDGHMPPWQPDTNYTRFLNEKIMSASEVSAILTWIMYGAPEGNPANKPPTPVFPKYKLRGTPDKIVKIPNFAINSTPTQDAYDVFAIPLNLTSDKIVKAIEIVPNIPSVVHHVVVTVDPTMTMTSDLSGNAIGEMGQIALSGSLIEPVIYPNSPLLKTGVKIPAQSQLYVQMHYSRSSGGLIDSTEFRLYFYPDNEPNVREMYIMVPLQNWYFWINPEEVKTIEVDTFESNTNTFDISIFSALPHSHKICTKVLNYAYHPVTRDSIPLLKIDRWDFHHQDYYYYKKLVHIPPGYNYKGIHTFDNTSMNPDNPFSPPQWIPVGLNSDDEMFFDAFQWLVYYPGDENINVDSIVKNDTLWAKPTLSSIIEHQYDYSFAFPNPTQKSFFIQLVGFKTTDEYKLALFDGIGNEIFPTVLGSDNSFEINLDGYPSGIYYYRLIDSVSGKVSTGKMVLN